MRRVPPSSGSQLALFSTFSCHAFICEREGETLALAADHRRHADKRERHPRPQLRGGAGPPAPGEVRGGRRLASLAGHGPQPRHLGEPHGAAGRAPAHEDPEAALLRPPGPAHACGAALASRAVRRLALERAVPGGAHAPARSAAPCLTEKGALTISPRETRPAAACPPRANGSPEALPAVRGDLPPSASGQLRWSSAAQEVDRSLPGQVRPARRG